MRRRRAVVRGLEDAVGTKGVDRIVGEVLGLWARAAAIRRARDAFRERMTDEETRAL